MPFCSSPSRSADVVLLDHLAAWSIAERGSLLPSASRGRGGGPVRLCLGSDVGRPTPRPPHPGADRPSAGGGHADVPRAARHACRRRARANSHRSRDAHAVAVLLPEEHHGASRFASSIEVSKMLGACVLANGGWRSAPPPGADRRGRKTDGGSRSADGPAPRSEPAGEVATEEFAERPCTTWVEVWAAAVASRRSASTSACASSPASPPPTRRRRLDDRTIARGHGVDHPDDTRGRADQPSVADLSSPSA